MVEYPLITLTCTSGKRPDLFRQTIESFLKNCLDRDLIIRWLVSDDGTDERDLNDLRKLFPFIEFLKADKPGQPASLNLLFSKVQTEWFFHLEDDWNFLNKGHFIRELFDIADTDPKLKYIGLRKFEPLREELLQETKSGASYVLHEFNTSYSYEKMIETDSCWFGWSLNPGLQNTKVIKQLGKFDEDYKPTTRWWDRSHPQKFLKLGYRRANIYDDYIEHVGGDQDSLYAMLRKKCNEAKQCERYPCCERCSR